MISDESTLLDARRWLYARLLEGAECPCCMRSSKIYKRKLNAGMAAMLLQVYRKTEELQPINGWLHISKLFLIEQRNAVAQEYSKLRYWGLLEPRPNSDPTVPGSGWWRLTDLGRAFARGEVSISKHVYVYDSEKVEDPAWPALDQVTVYDALEDSFDYDELMAGGK